MSAGLLALFLFILLALGFADKNWLNTPDKIWSRSPGSNSLVMGKRNYTHVQVLLPEIKAMLAEGKTQREVAEYYGFRDKQVVKRLLERERRKERKLAAGILPRPKGRPRKDAAPRNIVAEQAYEIQRLQMENKLLRDFLRFTGRR